MTVTEPVARGPLASVHRRAGATLQVVDGCEIAVRYPDEPAPGGNAIVDTAHRATHELNGLDTADRLKSLCGEAVPVRKIHVSRDRHTYRLSDVRGVVFGAQSVAGAINVTGGWSSVALYGPAARAILNKVTALDLRETALPVGDCCQGPIFGVNTLIGRFDDRYDLHCCPDMMQFLWEVLLDAGREFDLKPAGVNWPRT